jgi:Zn-dependent protease with chaperone function
MDEAFDWELPADDTPARLSRAVALAAGMAVAAALLGTGAAFIAGLPPLSGAAAGVVGVAVYMASRGRTALRASRAHRIRPEAEPRLASLVTGLSGDLGLKPPSIWIYETQGPNALVCGAGGGALAVARSAVDDLTRVELEALVAHCLVRLSSRATRIATVASIGRPIARLLGVIVGPFEDVRTAAVTRFPPALGAALEKAHLARGRHAPFYFAADGPSHADVDERRRALSDL